MARQPENTPPTNNWVLYTRLAGTAAFVFGPGNPPQGIGSLEMETPLATDKVTLFNYDHVGTQLSNITSIGYSTYREPTSVTTHPAQVPSINIQVDLNGDALGGFTTLVFEPVYNTAQGTVIPASTDALTLSYGEVCLLYDFEPFRATNECKKGGWETMSRADGTPFKNQGDCVSYVNTGK